MKNEIQAQSEAFVSTYTLNDRMGWGGQSLVEFKAGIAFLGAQFPTNR